MNLPEAIATVAGSEWPPDDININGKWWQLECTYLSRKEAMATAEMLDSYKLLRYKNGYALYERNYWID